MSLYDNCLSIFKESNNNEKTLTEIDTGFNLLGQTKNCLPRNDIDTIKKQIIDTEDFFG